jgi:catalase (peroxidase I)
MYCPKKCVFTPYGGGGGQCQNVIIDPKPTPSPMQDPPCCDNPRQIPTECEVRLLIEIMDEAVRVDLATIPQFLRLCFHDAGTFNQMAGEGGANGCLMNHPPMRNQPENLMLDLALNTLAAVKSLWEGNPDTCLNVSAADMTQFAGWFAVLRQKGVPGLTAAKKDEIVAKTNWGRPDEQNCDTAWTANLPGFQMGNGQPIPTRCKLAGGEIKNKMMDRNGFTAIEATALMGAHSIGMTRNVFGPS